MNPNDAIGYPDQEIKLHDGGRIVLFQYAGVQNFKQGVDPERNVIRFSSKGDDLWVIDKGDPIQGKWSTYIGLELIEDESILVYAHDGCVYLLDVDTGNVKKVDWQK